MGKHSVQNSGDASGGLRGHRSASGRRGVSVGVIVALVTVVVIVGGVILWRFFGDVLSERSSTAAQQCLKGTAAIAVIADPSIADNVTKFADGFNQKAPLVGDQCVKVVVKTADSDQVINGFVSGWPDTLGARPALWIPASSISTARLQSVAGKESVSDARSLVTSPVMLAVRPELKDALAQQAWATLPELQSNPSGLDALNLPGWGSLRLALPTVGDNDASYLTAEAVAAASAPPNTHPSAGLGAVNALVAGQPRLDDNTAATAWKALLSDGNEAASGSEAAGPAAGPVHAVVTTEQQLFQRTSSLPDADKKVAEWLPPGPVPTADYPTVLLAGSWLSQEQVTGASEFARYLGKPEQLEQLAKAGFRAGTNAPKGGDPKGNSVVSFAALAAPLSVGDDATRATLASALTVPATGSTTTIMFDQSLAGQADVVAAFANRIKALPPNSAVGLWAFDGTDGRSVVSTGPLSDQGRASTLASSLQGLSSSGGGAVSFTTLRLVYGNALANFSQGQPNSVLVITQGTHTDQTLDGPGLQDYVKSAVDQNRPVAINVIDIGDDSDSATWQSVAQLSGGTYQSFPAPDSPDLVAAVTSMLS
jgi:hypothetical protein